MSHREPPRIERMTGRFDPSTALLVSVYALHALAGCEGCDDADVVVYTSVDQVFSEPVFQHCERQTGLDVRAVFDTEETKSTGVLNRLLAESGSPQADIFWSGDPVRPFVLIDRGLVLPYTSEAVSEMPAEFRAQDGTWAGLAARARVLLVNTELVDSTARPTSVRDLADASWRGQAAIANPLFGTTTMHVAALFTVWGDEEARSFMSALKQNDVQIASSNGEVARLVIAGEVAFGLTDTDDAFEAVQAGEHVAVVYPDQDDLGALFMPTSVVLMRGAPHGDAGGRLLDCLLSAEVEARLAESGAHMPLRPGVPTPAAVRGASELRPMRVDYSQVAATMVRIEPWLREWVGL